MFAFSQRSLNALATVHDDLAKIAHSALRISPYDFTVTEGVRSAARQRQLKAQGVSQTLRSKHLDEADGILDGKGLALDFYPYFNGRVQTQAEWKYFERIAQAFKAAAHVHGKRITWGGDWVSLRDGPHIQLELT